MFYIASFSRVRGERQENHASRDDNLFHFRLLRSEKYSAFYRQKMWERSRSRFSISFRITQLKTRQSIRGFYYERKKHVHIFNKHTVPRLILFGGMTFHESSPLKKF